MNIGRRERLYRQQHNPANPGEEEDGQASLPSPQRQPPETLVGKERQVFNRKQDEEKQHQQRHHRLNANKPEVTYPNVKKPYVVSHRRRPSGDVHYSAFPLENTMANPSS